MCSRISSKLDDSYLELYDHLAGIASAKQFEECSWHVLDTVASGDIVGDLIADDQRSQ